MLFSWLHRRRNILKRMIRSEVTTVSVSGKTYGSVSQAFQYTSSGALSKIFVHLPCVDSNCNTRTQLNIMFHVKSVVAFYVKARIFLVRFLTMRSAFHVLHPWASEEFFPGSTKEFFQNFSTGRVKNGEICFFPLETKKTTFFLKSSKPGWSKAPVGRPCLHQDCFFL